ncbi:radical SAM protein [Marinifilum sp. JC120]|nr:radical SAM protein [Marinifilum sp. JC120]
MKYALNYRSGPDGLHLYDRKSGTNILLDEFEISSENWSPAPRQVSIALTNACNLQCPFCYAPKQLAELSYVQLQTWLDELNTNGCLGIGFGGGEPTLYKNLPLLCDYINNHTKLAVTFTTNAHNLSVSLADQLKGRVAYVRVSMDGVGETYEILRGKSFASLCSRFERIRSIAAFGINYVVNSQTFPDLDEAVMVAADHGATELLLLPELPTPGREGIDPVSVSNLKEWVYSYSGPLRLSVSEAGADKLPTCDPLVKEKGLRSYAHIDASGILKRSSFDSVGVKIGDGGIIKTLSKLRPIPVEVGYENLA